MKKVLAWVLTLALVLSSFSMCFAFTDDAAVEEADCSVQALVLTELGVIEGYEDGSFQPAKTVTRAEMAIMLIRALGFNDNKGACETKFSDVEEESWCSGAVAYATELGLIEGYPDGTFKPSNTVNYNEAVTMIIRALGYQESDLNGDKWPGNYVNQAETIRLFEGLDEDLNCQDGASRGDCAIMIYNALTDLLQSYYNDNSELAKYDTMLERLLDKTGKDLEILGSEEEPYIIEMDDIAAYDGLTEENLGEPCQLLTIEDKAIVVEAYAESYDVTDVDFDDMVVTIGDKEYTVKNVDYLFQNGYVTPYDFDNDRTDGIVPNPYGYKVWADLDGKKIDITSVLNWDANETSIWDDEAANTLEEENIVNFENFIENDDDAIDTAWFFLYGASSLDSIEEDDVVTSYAGLEMYIEDLEEMTASEEAAQAKIEAIEEAIEDMDIPGYAKEMAIKGSMPDQNRLRDQYSKTMLNESYYNAVAMIANYELVNSESEVWKGIDGNKKYDIAVADVKASMTIDEYDALFTKAKELKDAKEALADRFAPNREYVNTKIEVGTEKVDGTCDEINMTTGVATIDGTDYDAAVPAWSVARFGLDFAGETGTAYLNYKGDIAYWSTEKTTYQYGILDDLTIANIKISTSNIGDIYQNIVNYADKNCVLPFDLTASIIAADKTDGTYDVTFDTTFDISCPVVYQSVPSGTIVEIARTMLKKAGTISDSNDSDGNNLLSEITKYADIVTDGLLCAYSTDGTALNAIQLTSKQLIVESTTPYDSGYWANSYTDVTMNSGKIRAYSNSSDWKDYAVSEDVVVFAKDSNDPVNSEWTTYGYSDLEEGLELKALNSSAFEGGYNNDLGLGKTTYILNEDGEIAAIKCDYCLEQPTAGFYLVTGVEEVRINSNTDRYNVTFFNGDTVSTIAYKGRQSEISAALEDKFCYVQFDVNGYIISIVPATPVNNDPIMSSADLEEFLEDEDTDLADGQFAYVYVGSVSKDYSSSVERIGYNNSLYDVTNATVINYDGSEYTASSYNSIKLASEALLIYTDDDDEIADYVLWDYSGYDLKLWVTSL